MHFEDRKLIRHSLVTRLSQMSTLILSKGEPLNPSLITSYPTDMEKPEEETCWPSQTQDKTYMKRRKREENADRILIASPPPLSLTT